MPRDGTGIPASVYLTTSSVFPGFTMTLIQDKPKPVLTEDYKLMNVRMCLLTVNAHHFLECERNEGAVCISKERIHFRV